jgi:hypothetical protein
MGTKLITYACVAAGHQPTANGADKLTIYEGCWAFCPFDAHAGDHTWKHTDGEAFEVLLRQSGLSVNLDVREVSAHAK